jgi:polysaccharide export outer membrane protein
VSSYRLSRPRVRVVSCLAALVGLGGCTAPGFVPVSANLPTPPGYVSAPAAAVVGPDPIATGAPADGPPQLPRELDKVHWPTYRIETPDLLLINALRVLPLPGYRIEPFDALLVVVPNAPPASPIRDVYPVDPDGTINFGPDYSNEKIRVAGLTIAEARAAIVKYLKGHKIESEVTVTLSQAGGMQDIRGEHIVGPDGTVRLGVYGSVRVCGMTLDEARAAIERHLGQFLYRPQVSVDVVGYNSKVYYVVTDGGGNGEQVVRLPATGNETVLDAISYINGLPPVASKKRVWLSRPSLPGGPRQVLPVDWDAIVRGGETATNYQILPGDRVYVMAKPIITFDTALARFIAPIERVLGVTLLGRTTVGAFQGEEVFGR